MTAEARAREDGRQAERRLPSSSSKGRESSRREEGREAGERRQAQSKAVMFSLSPRTLDQTLKGAPAVFKCAQEVDLGRYDSSRLGMSVPGGWDQDPKYKTRTELLQARRKSKIPDATFDLDGDGIVSREEYTLSVKHDRDRDGRLCTPERESALRALKDNHPLTKFTNTRPQTVPMNVDEEGQGKERPRTRTELMRKRREENLQHNQKGYEQYEEAVSKVVPLWKSSEEYKKCQDKYEETKPPKKTRSQEIEKLRQTSRKLCDLHATTTCLNPDRNSLDPVAHISGQVQYEDPNSFTFMGYKEAPKFKTRSSLQDFRASRLLNELDKTVTQTAKNFKSMRRRLEDREDALFLKAQIALSDPNNRVRSDLKHDAKQNNMKQLMALWEKEKEPPMNAARASTPNSRVPFWTLTAGYQDAPPISSAMELRESKKWFKKVPEAFLTSSPQGGGGGGGGGDVFDPYNRTRMRTNAGQESLTGKVTSSAAAELEGREQTYRPRPPAKSEIRNQAGEEAPPNYLTEEAISSAHQRLMDVPLFSSFAPDFVFRPPPLPLTRSRRPSRQSSPALRAHQEALAGQQELEASRSRMPLQPPPKMQTILVSPNRVDATGAERRGTGASSGPRASGSYRSLLERGTQIRSSGFVG